MNQTLHRYRYHPAHGSRNPRACSLSLSGETQEEPLSVRIYSHIVDR